MRKKGFSLAELLIVLAIIGVLTALCIAAGQKSLQNAYNLHYYRSLNAVTQAFEDYIYTKGHETMPDANGVVRGVNPLGGNGFCPYFSSLVDTNVLGKHAKMSVACKTYDVNFNRIDITIPKVKSSADPSTTATYSVLYHTGYITSGDYKSSSHAPFWMVLGTDAALYMIDNPRILPVYVDTGSAGKVGYFDDDNPNELVMEPITPISYRQAFCLTADTTSKGSVLSNYPSTLGSYCNPIGVSPDDKLKGMPIRLLKPKYIN